MKNIFAAICTALLIACSSSRITSTWKVKDLPKMRFEKIMVIGLMKEDVATKAMMEMHLVDDLERSGFKAFSAYNEFGPKAFENVNEKQSLTMIRKKGFDAVITIVLLNKQQEKEYVSERVIHSPYYVYQNRFWSYYITMNERIQSTEYYTTHNRYFWESNLYDLTAKRLLYSVQTESFDPATTKAMAHEYGKMIVKSMITNNVLDSATVLH